MCYLLSGKFAARQTFTVGGCYQITNAVFQNCISSTRGGAMFLNGTAAILIMQTVTFQNCTCTGYMYDGRGGGFTFNGSVYQGKYICGIDCTASMGQLCSFVDSGKITMNMTTAIRCPYSYSTSYRKSSIQVVCGYANINYLNSSWSKSYFNGGAIGLSEISTTKVTYLTAANEKVANIVDLYLGDGTLSMSSLNILNNTATACLFYFSSSWAISNVIIQNNKGTLFVNYDQSGKLTLSQCYCDVAIPSVYGLTTVSCKGKVNATTYAIVYSSLSNCPVNGSIAAGAFKSISLATFKASLSFVGAIVLSLLAFIQF